MHFAIDQKATVVSKSLEKQAAEKTLAQKDAGEKADPLPTEMLTEARPILLYGERDTRGRVEVSMRESVRKGKPSLSPVRRRQSVGEAVPALLAERFATHRHPGSAVSDRAWETGNSASDLPRSLKVKHSAPLSVIDGSEIAPVAPGANGLGWVVLEQPKVRGEAPALRFQFAADTRGPVDAVLVLASLREP